MNAAAGPFTIAVALLALGGAFKAASPADTATALRGVGLPGWPLLVRLGGVLEMAVAVVALATGGRAAAALVAISYLGFAGFVAVALARGVPIATCGCFGKADTPPSVVHLVINLGAAAAALAVVVDPGVALADVVADQPLEGVPYLLLVATGVYLTFVALTRLPRLLVTIRASRSA